MREMVEKSRLTEVDATKRGGLATFVRQEEKLNSCPKPVWLLSTLSDLDQRIISLVLSSDKDNDKNQLDTFATRAESYYQQRPKLLSLLLDLYNNYLSLADRYCLTLHNHIRHSSIDHAHGPYSSSEPFSGSSVCLNEEETQSDAESSLSYQIPIPIPVPRQPNLNDEIITELVVKNVEYDLMAYELALKEKEKEKEPFESSRKIELQKSLLEVLESERMILLNENAGLRYKVNALTEENKGLASESMFMKRKAGELARCVLNMRKDHRVCMLSRKIEDLQGKICRLERRNQEYSQKLVKREKRKCPSCEERIATKNTNNNTNSRDDAVRAETCFQEQKKSARWWNKVKSCDFLFLCKPYPSKLYVG